MKDSHSFYGFSETHNKKYKFIVENEYKLYNQINNGDGIGVVYSIHATMLKTSNQNYLLISISQGDGTGAGYE